MSILIKGMKLPENGYLAIVPTGEVFISGNGWGFQSYGWSVQPDGQAVELPDHGDLIDRDAMRKDWKFSDSCNRCERDAYRCQYHEEMSTMDVCGMLDDAPVVIPAERSEE